jgi:hypothetical protein
MNPRDRFEELLQMEHDGLLTAAAREEMRALLQENPSWAHEADLDRQLVAMMRELGKGGAPGTLLPGTIQRIDTESGTRRGRFGATGMLAAAALLAALVGTTLVWNGDGSDSQNSSALRFAEEAQDGSKREQSVAGAASQLAPAPAVARLRNGNAGADAESKEAAALSKAESMPSGPRRPGEGAGGTGDSFGAAEKSLRPVQAGPHPTRALTSTLLDSFPSADLRMDTDEPERYLAMLSGVDPAAFSDLPPGAARYMLLSFASDADAREFARRLSTLHEEAIITDANQVLVGYTASTEDGLPAAEAPVPSPPGGGRGNIYFPGNQAVEQITDHAGLLVMAARFGGEKLPETLVGSADGGTGAPDGTLRLVFNSGILAGRFIEAAERSIGDATREFLFREADIYVIDGLYYLDIPPFPK